MALPLPLSNIAVIAGWPINPDYVAIYRSVYFPLFRGVFMPPTATSASTYPNTKALFMIPIKHTTYASCARDPSFTVLGQYCCPKNQWKEFRKITKLLGAISANGRHSVKWANRRRLNTFIESLYTTWTGLLGTQESLVESKDR